MNEEKIMYVVEFCRKAGRIPTERELAIYILYGRIENN